MHRRCAVPCARVAERRPASPHAATRDGSESGQNRVHLDIFVDDLDSEVARLVGLGARTVEEHNDEGGYRTAVLADPLENEFCLVQR
ncbi:VOC family protein [Williamsia muralis]|uniref:VOC family protein n=1 Tax=Williamsia marianensis TaxID=85044 RepID=UPI001B85B411